MRVVSERGLIAISPGERVVSCPSCGRALEERSRGDWCPRCRGWLRVRPTGADDGSRIAWLDNSWGRL